MLQPLASHSHHAHMAHEIERNHQALIQILGRPYPVLYADSKAMFVSNQDAPWFHRFFIEKFSLSDRAETAGLLSKIKDAVARGSHNDFKLFGQEEDNCKDPSSVGVFGSSSFPYLERHLGKWKTIGEEIEMAKEMHTLDDLASLGGSTFSSSKDPRITFNIRRILPSEASQYTAHLNNAFWGQDASMYEKPDLYRKIAENTQDGSPLGTLLLYGAFFEKQMVGTGWLFTTSKVAGIETISTHADWRGQGIGRNMVAYLMREGSKQGAQIAALHSYPNKQELYLHLGFEPLGVTRHIDIRP